MFDYFRLFCFLPIYQSETLSKDIQGSQAYAQGLEKAGYLTQNELHQIREGLTKITQEWQSEEFTLHDTDEDIHTANERRLCELIGPVGGKLHTARSRNDQVQTDVHLWLINSVKLIQNEIRDAIESLLSQAEQHIDQLFPSYTHLQPAQVIRYSHWLLNHATSLRQCWKRFDDIDRTGLLATKTLLH